MLNSKCANRRQFLLIICMIVIIAMLSGCGVKSEAGSGDTDGVQKVQKDGLYTTVLTNGVYTVGVDFPAGTYDIKVLEGEGSVSSYPDFSELMAVEGYDDDFKQLCEDVLFKDEDIVSVDSVTVHITSDNVSNKPLIPRIQDADNQFKIGNGEYVCGIDFEPGIYDLEVISGSGDILVDDIPHLSIDTSMNEKESDGEYKYTFKNAEFFDGIILNLRDVEIALTPNHVGTSTVLEAPIGGFSTVLSNGTYTVGVDIPAGTYDIEAVSGCGLVHTGNAWYEASFSKTMAEEGYSDKFESVCKDVMLADGFTINMDNITIRITSENVSDYPLAPRIQDNDRRIELGGGVYTSGIDFEPGIYDIEVISGSGDLVLTNAPDVDINTERIYRNSKGNYIYTSKNAQLIDGAVLDLSEVKIALTPNHIGKPAAREPKVIEINSDGSFSTSLSDGYYVAGVDFPTGVYDLKLLSGSGYISTSNGEVSIIMGPEGSTGVVSTKSENAEIKDFVNSFTPVQFRPNVSLEEGVVLEIATCTIEIETLKASNKPLKPRKQEITNRIILDVWKSEDGLYTSGVDFEPGVYDVEVLWGYALLFQQNKREISAPYNSNLSITIDDFEEVDTNNPIFRNAYFAEGLIFELEGAPSIKTRVILTPSRDTVLK